MLITLQINRNGTAEEKEEEKLYEDKECFKDQIETCKSGQVGIPFIISTSNIDPAWWVIRTRWWDIQRFVWKFKAK